MLPNIFDYIDYRLFILDTAAALNKTDPSFSFSDLAHAAGSDSPDFLRLIRDRLFHLSESAFVNLCEYLNLEQRQREYFSIILAFDQAETNVAKDEFLKTILESKQYSMVKQLKEEQYKFFSRWYMPVVRELIISQHYHDDPAWIAANVVPSLTLEQVEDAIHTLVDLDLIYRDETNGKWKQTDTVICTSPEVQLSAIKKYHSDVINLGRESIKRFNSNERDIRAITLSLSEKGYNKIKRRLESFWKEMLTYAETEEDSDRIYQINMQCFPVSTIEVKDEKLHMD